MTEPDFNCRTRNAAIRRRNLPNRVEKYVDGAWAKMSDWPTEIDEAKLQRHVRALGGSVRFVRNEKTVREWRNGQEIAP